MGRGCTRAVDTCDGYITAAHLSRELWLLHRDRLVAEPSEIHRARGSVVNLPKVSGELALGHREVDVSGPAAVPEARRPRVVHRHRVGPIDPPSGGWHREVSKVPWVCGRASRGCVRPATRKRGLCFLVQSGRRFSSGEPRLMKWAGRSLAGAHTDRSARTVGLASSGRLSTHGDHRIGPFAPRARTQRGAPVLPVISERRSRKKQKTNSNNLVQSTFDHRA
jgi:hypothetical protein